MNFNINPFMNEFKSIIIEPESISHYFFHNRNSSGIMICSEDECPMCNSLLYKEIRNNFQTEKCENCSNICNCPKRQLYVKCNSCSKIT